MAIQRVNFDNYQRKVDVPGTNGNTLTPKYVFDGLPEISIHSATGPSPFSSSSSKKRAMVESNDKDEFIEDWSSKCKRFDYFYHNKVFPENNCWRKKCFS